MKNIILFLLITNFTFAQRIVDTRNKYKLEIKQNKEYNDCAVRMYAEAFDLQYNEALAITTKYGRKRGKGMKLGSYLKSLRDSYGNRFVYSGRVREGMNYWDFVREVVQNGFTYVVVLYDHAYVVEKENKGVEWYLKGNLGDRFKEIYAYIKINNNKN